MERHRRRRKWQQWNGSIDQFGRAAGEAVAVLEEQTGEKFDCRVEVERGERTWESDRPSALGRLADADLSKIASLKLDVFAAGDVYVDPWDEWGQTLSWQVFIRAESQAPSLTLEVSGPDQTIQDGLFERLCEILRPRSPRPGWINRQRLALIACLFLALTIAALDAVEYLLGFGPSDGFVTKWEWLVEGSMIAFTTVTGGLAWWALPDFEIVALDERPRLTRSSRVIASIVGVLALEVVASFAAAAIQGT